MIFIEPASQKIMTPPTAGTADLNKFLGDITPAIEKDGKAIETAACVIKQAALPWTYDPFVTSGYAELSRMEAGGAGGMTAGFKYSYSGYLKMGDKKMIAIIDGMEYETREELLDGSGYIVTSISPERVVLESGDTGSQLVIPLEESLKGDI